MNIAGYVIIKNRRSWVRYCRGNGYTPEREPEPKKYPCILDDRLGADEEGYLQYLYLNDVEKMRNALIKMGGGKGLDEIQLELPLL